MKFFAWDNKTSMVPVQLHSKLSLYSPSIQVLCLLQPIAEEYTGIWEMNSWYSNPYICFSLFENLIDWRRWMHMLIQVSEIRPKDGIYRNEASERVGYSSICI